jgi:hypothetical protein
VALGLRRSVGLSGLATHFTTLISCTITVLFQVAVAVLTLG